jgi:hypothetical protein
MSPEQSLVILSEAKNPSNSQRSFATLRMTIFSTAFLLLVSCGDGGSGGRDPVEPSTGLLEITIATSGATPTGSGYTYILDNNPARPIAFNTTIQLRGLFTGTHTIELTGLPQECAVAGQNPVTANVTSDVPATALFEVSCVEPGLGSITVTTATSGPGAAINYALLVDGEDEGSIAANGTVALPDVPAGFHAVGVAGIPANCQLQEPDPQAVTVLADETANAPFTITCTTPPASSGMLSITVSTSGTDPDGYLVSVDGGAAQPISINGSMTITNVPTGSHSIQLSGLARSCTVAGLNPVTMTVSAGLVARPSFAVSCGGSSS